ncbi:MAG: DNA topoisomerase (ATP-hydrolyzing) subunit A [Oscillospiraceae bacterium]|nr:DNA topoisomerase (ATP-hydrolyzing) subunit A [Oscillospiraceae bacterium]
MPRKKQTKTDNKPKKASVDESVEILSAGEIIESAITDTLETNYMPYAMSVIVSRALPEIDGFKPSHRKLLYTMYGMGLLKGNRTKSANIVGQTMKLNPHGDAAIYETMVRLSRGNEALLVPFVDSKGNFGKAYSSGMAYAASRYTEAKLEPVCEELFRDIDSDTVDFVDNYDSTMKEPTLLPVTFPNILTNNTLGIAVGMASSICSFNLAEVCNTTIALLRDENHNVKDTLPAPDFVGGGYILYDESDIDGIYETGRGRVRVQSKWNYVKEDNLIEVTQIPPTTTVEAIMDKVAELVKRGKITEISDMRDETDLKGLKITFDLKRGKDPEKLMQRLFKMTPLEDNFSANFNVLIAGAPKVMGVREIITEWIAFRYECVRRRVFHDLQGKKSRLHLVKGLERILLDIDKAVSIVRNTEDEKEVVPNLMIGFGIDEVQAEYVAEIRLRQLNRNYIIKRIDEREQLEKDIAELESVLKSESKVKKIIISELENVIKKYGADRKSEIKYGTRSVDIEEEPEEIPAYRCHVFATRGGYLKKITPASLRMASEQKLKQDDEIVLHTECTNDRTALVFTDKCSVYKAKLNDFADTKRSALGEYLPAKLGMEENESVIKVLIINRYKGRLLFCFENGKVAKIPLSAYETKQNRRKLINAFSDKSKVVDILCVTEAVDIVLVSTRAKAVIVNSATIPEKSTKNSVGVQVMTLKKGRAVKSAQTAQDAQIEGASRRRAKSIPARGTPLKAEDIATQMTLE